MAIDVSGYVVGVDGGGSGCRAVLLDAEGRERGRADGGPVVAHAGPGDSAVAEVVRVVRRLLTESGVRAPVGALWAGLAGAGRARARASVTEGLVDSGLARRVQVDTDVTVAFHDAFGEAPGVLLLAGTGSVAWGRGPDGKEGRSGGWGPVLGDEGSGYVVGLAGLWAVARADDGRGPATGLGDALLAELELPEDVGDPDGRGDPRGQSAHQLVEWIDGAPRARVAELAPVVVEVAGQGDAVASAIMGEAVEALVAHVAALERRLGPWTEPPPVVLGGGLLRSGRPLAGPVRDALTSMGFPTMDRSPDGALGAAKLAQMLVRERRVPGDPG